jgi:hypothetical protein
MTTSYRDLQEKLAQCIACLTADRGQSSGGEAEPHLELIDLDLLHQTLREASALLDQAGVQSQAFDSMREWFIGRIVALDRASALLTRQPDSCCRREELEAADPALLPSRCEREIARLRALQSGPPGNNQSKAKQKELENFKS